jgi:hypothetical protein
VAGAACPASRIAPEKISARVANLQQVILNIGNLISRASPQGKTKATQGYRSLGALGKRDGVLELRCCLGGAKKGKFWGGFGMVLEWYLEVSE